MTAMGYTSVLCQASAEYTDRKSLFIGYVKPVSTKEEALDFISQIRKKHSDARHNVYAYVTRDGNSMGYSDDGEPQGTGGVPMLNVLNGNELVDVCCVVTRYFGGTLLGVGGLVRAYTEGAKIAVAAGGIKTVAESADITGVEPENEIPETLEEEQPKEADEKEEVAV